MVDWKNIELVYSLVVAIYFKTIEQLLSDFKLIVDKTVGFKEFSSDEGIVREQ